MSNHLIITIGRQFGSGGHEIGKTLAQQLKINFYDRELLRMAAKQSGISEALFQKYDETTNSTYLHTIISGIMPDSGTFLNNEDMVTNDKLFALQSDVIREIANRESCVLVGRGSNYVLRNERRLVRVFIHCDFDKRLERIQEIHKLGKKEATDMIKKTDKKRAAYSSYFTGSSWEDLNNYDICINSGKIGFENSVDLIKQYAESIIQA